MLQWGARRLAIRHLLCALAGLSLLAVSAVADTPTIQNGDFETPRIGPPFVSTADVPGWTHTGSIGLGNLVRTGYTDALGSATVAGHGSQFLLIGTGPDISGDATWSTDISGLTPGVTYSLGFLMASQLPRLATTVTVSFTRGSSTPPQSFMVSPFDFAYWANWEPKQMTFIAAAPVTTVTFSTFEQRGEIGLDYVTVGVAVPPILPPSVTSITSPIGSASRLAVGGPMLITGANLGTGPDDVAVINIRGEQAPVVSFLNSTSLIAQVPVDLPAGQTTVTVTHNGATTNALPVTVAEFSPEIYYPGASAFTDSNGNSITQSHLAIPGTAVTCVAIGLGPTTPPMVTGTKATAAAPTATPVQVLVAGALVVPDFAGLLVGSVTDYQVTFKIPPTTPAGSQPVTLTVGGVNSNTVTLLTGAGVAQVTGVVNGASFKAGTVSPNSFVSIFGDSFGNEDTASNIFPALAFNQVAVLVNSMKVPLYNVIASRGQINLVMPSELPEFGTALVQVANAQGISRSFQVQLAPDSVGLFRIADPSDANRKNGAVVFANTAWKVMPLSMAAALKLPSCASVDTTTICGQPAKAGDQVQIFLTGLGKATPNGDPNGAVLATGTVAPADGSVLYKTVQNPTVKIGGIQADVSFSGIAPGNAGQYQINVTIPNGVQPGNSVPLTVTMPDGSSDTVTIAVQS